MFNLNMGHSSTVIYTVAASRLREAGLLSYESSAFNGMDPQHSSLSPIASAQASSTSYHARVYTMPGLNSPLPRTLPRHQADGQLLVLVYMRSTHGSEREGNLGRMGRRSFSIRRTQ